MRSEMLSGNLWGYGPVHEKPIKTKPKEETLDEILGISRDALIKED